jgi:hypothetical protein
LEVPLYQIFYSGEEAPAQPEPITPNPRLLGFNRADARFLMQLRRALSRTKEADRESLLHIARKLAKGKVDSSPALPLTAHLPQSCYEETRILQGPQTEIRRHDFSSFVETSSLAFSTYQM